MTKVRVTIDCPDTDMRDSFMGEISAIIEAEFLAREIKYELEEMSNADVYTIEFGGM